MNTKRPKQNIGWIARDGVKFQEDTLADLLSIYQSSAQHHLDCSLKLMTYYSSIIAGLLAATIALGEITNASEWRVLVCVFQLFIIAYSFVGMKQCERLYNRHMEDISQVVKLEIALGLYSPVRVKHQCEGACFAEDPWLAAHAFATDLTFTSSSAFVLGNSRVRNRIKWTFRLYIIIALALFTFFVMRNILNSSGLFF